MMSQHTQHNYINVTVFIIRIVTISTTNVQNIFKQIIIYFALFILKTKEI